MTKQETAFADEYIFLLFNGSETMPARIAEYAAVKAGYEMPADCTAKDTFCKGLLSKEDIEAYIADQTAAFRAKLSAPQRRNLWAAITAMEAGEPSNDLGGVMPLKVC
jgi:hypothetical protein